MADLSRIRRVIYTFCRYFVAFWIITYGFAKLNDAQFTVLQSVLDKPLREIPGFWLTWYYFGYSEVYGNLIALVQVAGGILLLFRRTTLLAGCVLIGVMANILLVNIFYGIGGGAFIMALLLTGGLVFILWQHRDELVKLFWSAQNKVLPSHDISARKRAFKGGLRVLVVVLPALLTYWIANYNNRLPTPIDGAWEVTAVRGAADTTWLPTRIYFEYNRAYMSVFSYPDSSVTHHFEVNDKQNVLNIWNQWLRKGEKIFSGKYDLNRGTLKIWGKFAGRDHPVRIILVRRNEDVT